MKTRWLLLLCALCLFFDFDTATAQAQQASNTSDSPIQIDPRQYVTVLYRKSASETRLIPIWGWENNPNIPSQKVELLDNNGIIKIQFSTNGIIKNYDFEGTVSVEAEISGANGTRKIEVNPYSEVGVQRLPIGIKSAPPSEIAKKLLNMLRSIKDADTVYHQLLKVNKSTVADSAQQKTAQQSEDALLSYIQSAQFDDSEARKKLDDFEDGVRFYYGTSRDIAYHGQVLKNFMQEVIDNYNKSLVQSKKDYQEAYKLAFTYSKLKTDLVLKYLTSFEASGTDATKAFLSLLNKDEIGYQELKNNFSENQKKLSLLDISDDAKIETFIKKNSKLIVSATKSLVELSDFEATPFEELLLKLKQGLLKSDESSKTDTIVNSKQPLINLQRSRAVNFDFIDKHLDTLSKRLSIEAGKIIYKKLIYGIIDLGKSGAKTGEVLNIYLTWIQDSRKDSLDNSPRLPLGKYYLAETGWRPEIADMFSLVKRIHEPTNASDLSPSNFKGTGGAVLMWTYHKQDNGLKIDSTNHKLSISKSNQLINFFEPSFGINVSALDFSTSKDVEIGTGMQMGLFSNKIFFGFGLNLHMISPAHQSPGYFFIGFSFAKLADLFKSAPSISSSQ